MDDGWMDEWADGWVDGWMDGWMDGGVCVCVCVCDKRSHGPVALTNKSIFYRGGSLYRASPGRPNRS